MKQKDIAAVLDEPACSHNKKEKSGCAKPKPGATAGGCAFDGAQIALLPIAVTISLVGSPLPANRRPESIESRSGPLAALRPGKAPADLLANVPKMNERGCRLSYGTVKKWMP